MKRHQALWAVMIVSASALVGCVDVKDGRRNFGSDSSMKHGMDNSSWQSGDSHTINERDINQRGSSNDNASQSR